MKISEALGITQEQAADLLNISKSLVSMYEIGKRELPTQALIKYSKLITHINDVKTKQNENALQEESRIEKSIEIINHTINSYTLKQLKLEKELKKVIQQQKKAFAAKQVVLYELEHNKENNPDLLELIKIEAEEKYKKNDWEIQLTLEVEIEGLKQMIKTLKKRRDTLIK